MNKWFNKFNKLTKVFIVIGMIFSMCFSAGNTTSVEAWDNTIPHEFTRIKEINYPWWWSKKIGSTKQWSTVMTKYNGKYAVVGFDGSLRIYEETGEELFSGSLLDSADFARCLKGRI